MATTQKLLSKFEAADVLSVTSYQLVRMANEGKVPCVRLPNGEIRFVEKDLLAWIEQTKTKASKIQPVFWSLAQAAEWMGVSEPFLERMATETAIPGCVRFPFGPKPTLTFDVDKLAEWVKSMEANKQ